MRKMILSSALLVALSSTTSFAMDDQNLLGLSNPAPYQSLGHSSSAGSESSEGLALSTKSLQNRWVNAPAWYNIPGQIYRYFHQECRDQENDLFRIISGLNARLSESQAATKEALRRGEELQEKVEEGNATIGQSGEIISRLSAQANDVEKYREQNKKLQVTLRKRNQSLAEMRKVLQSKRVESTNLQGQVAELEGQVVDLGEKYHKSSVRGQKHKQHIKALRKELKARNKASGKAQKRDAALLKKHAESNEKLTLLLAQEGIDWSKSVLKGEAVIDGLRKQISLQQAAKKEPGKGEDSQQQESAAPYSTALVPYQSRESFLAQYFHVLPVQGDQEEKKEEEKDSDAPVTQGDVTQGVEDDLTVNDLSAKNEDKLPAPASDSGVQDLSEEQQEETKSEASETAPAAAETSAVETAPAAKDSMAGESNADRTNV